MNEGKRSSGRYQSRGRGSSPASSRQRSATVSGDVPPSTAGKTSFELIESVLKGALRQCGLDQDIARYRFVTHWSEIVGESIAERTRPECIRQGQLVVRVLDSVWAQELSFRRDAILKRLQRFLDSGEIVSDIRFYVGTLPAR